MIKNKLLRVILLFSVLAAFGVYYFYNQQQFAKIGDLSAWEIVLIIIGQSIVIISNIFILMIFGRFIARRIHFIDAARITAYSSLINFFGFLQGGVGFRGLYLKKHMKMSLRRYFALTVVQYCIFFSIAGLLLLIGLWLTSGVQQAVLFVLFALFVACLIALIIDRIKPIAYLRLRERLKKMDNIIQVWPLLGIAAATILQLSGSMLANAVELNAVGAQLSLGSLLIYTGVSQFAIIIALTPGAIGIRETILLAVQHQMNLTTETIIVASTIDRLIYFVTLALFTPLALRGRRSTARDARHASDDEADRTEPRIP